MILTSLVIALTSFAAPTILNDSQINHVLETINEGEIDAAKIAMSHAQGETAKNFAKMMRNEHMKNLQEAKLLAKKDNLKSEKSDLCESIAADAKSSNASMKKANKDAFDLGYLNEQIEMHQKALATIKNTLLPNAHSDDLKKLLSETQKHVEAHLAMAKNASVKVATGTN
jgi:putative membrane protein